MAAQACQANTVSETMSRDTISWNLYKELRRPLNYIEAKFNTVQAEPLLSIAIEPYDLLAYHDTPVVAKKKDRVLTSASRTMRPLTGSSSKGWKMSAEYAKYGNGLMAEDKAGGDGDTILYAIHPKTDDDAEIAVTKYRWNNETMRYMHCKVTPRRVVSAPPTVASPSHLQRLFEAAHLSQPSNYCKTQRRSQTATVRPKRSQTLLHNSERSSHVCSEENWPNIADLSDEVKTEKLIPLSFEQAAQTNKVIPINDNKKAKPIQSMSETMPVVFNKDYSPKPYTPAHSMRRPDGFAVHQEKGETVGLCGRKTPITKLEIILSVDEPEVLDGNEQKGIPSPEGIEMDAETPESAKCEEDVEEVLSSPSPNAEPKVEEAEIADKPIYRKKKRSMSRYKFSFKSSPSTNTDRVKTPTVSAEMRSHIVRQCSMPSYAVMHQQQNDSTDSVEQSSVTKAVAVERFTETKERVKNITKPVYQPFVDRNTTKSTPTITPNGPSGSKIFMSITTPNTAVLNKKPNSLTRVNSLRSQRTNPSPQPRHTPQELQRLLVESSHTQDKYTVRALSASRGRSIALSPKRGSIAGRKSSRSSLQGKTTANNESTRAGRQVDVSIPTAGETFSAVSSAAYSDVDDTVSRSCDLDDVRSDASEFIYTSLPATPVPEKEDTEAMKDRVHRELLKTMTETEQFLQAMDQRRKNRPPQIVYSDDEEELPEEITHYFVQDFVNAGAGDKCDSVNSDVMPRNESNSGCNSAAADIDLHEFSDQFSESEVSLANSSQSLTSSQQYLQLVNQFENDLSISAAGRPNDGIDEH